MSKVKWDANCPQESKDAIIKSIDEKLQAIIDLIRSDERVQEEPEHRIIKGLKEYFE